ncbi:MAG: hypothetical protein P8I38_13250 [Arenicella sp.]|jgi:hypothetical protein|nr:hypothetical protein [Arenicella sp.]
MNMNVENEVYPSDMEKFMAPGPEGPIFMVNLLKYKDKAEYKDGRESTLTGRQAYGLYSAEVVNLVAEHGGHEIFWADVSEILLGKVESLWDAIAIVMYPNRGSLMGMSSSEGMKKIAMHRHAGLEGQLNIETVNLPERLSHLLVDPGAQS